MKKVIWLALGLAIIVLGLTPRSAAAVTAARNQDTIKKGVEYGVWSPDSKFFAAVVEAEDFSTQIEIFDVTTEKWFTLASNATGIAWSPDSLAIAFTRMAVSTAGFRVDLFIVKFDSGDAEQLTSSKMGEYMGYPIFSPDGEWILFSAGNGNLQKVSLIDKKIYQLTKGGIDSPKKWENGRIYFSSLGRPHQGEYSMASDGSALRFEGERKFPHYSSEERLPSPDGKWVATINKREHELTLQKTSS